MQNPSAWCQSASYEGGQCDDKQHIATPDDEDDSDDHPDDAKRIGGQAIHGKLSLLLQPGELYAFVARGVLHCPETNVTDANCCNQTITLTIRRKIVKQGASSGHSAW